MFPSGDDGRYEAVSNLLDLILQHQLLLLQSRQLQLIAGGALLKAGYGRVQVAVLLLQLRKPRPKLIFSFSFHNYLRVVIFALFGLRCKRWITICPTLNLYAQEVRHRA